MTIKDVDCQVSLFQIFCQLYVLIRDLALRRIDGELDFNHVTFVLGLYLVSVIIMRYSLQEIWEASLWVSDATYGSVITEV